MDRYEEIKGRLLDYFEENEDVFNDVIIELDCLDGFLDEDKFYDMEELDEYVCGSPIEILMKAHFGKDLDSQDKPFNPDRDYFRFNAYGNLESTDYPDYSSHLDNDFIEEVIDKKDELYTVEDNEELQEILS